MALQAREALLQSRPGWVGLSVKMMGEAPTVANAKVTDPAGNVLFTGRGDSDQSTLDPVELAQIPLVAHQDPHFFAFGNKRWESVSAIYTGRDLRGYAWVEYHRNWAREQVDSIVHDTILFGIIWVLASAILVLLMARAISRPLAILHRGTRALMTEPDNSTHFPLPTGVQNEFGDLILAFNRMVASIAEQRAGLNDTLSLLDSMLANAPIGLAFFDRSCRFTRVNHPQGSSAPARRPAN
jgi:methyl-accepting chemotaxis protein